MEVIQKLIQVISWIIANYQPLLTSGLVVVGGTVTFLNALIAFFMLIPGPHPEQELQKVVDWIESKSKK
jgi:Zn-dependent protease